MLYSPTQIEEKKDGIVHLMNYTAKDFSMEYLDDNNKLQKITIPAVDTKSFPASLAELVKTHLANFILNLEGFSYKTDPKLEIKKIKDKITLHE